MNILFVSDWDFTLLYKEISKKLKLEFNSSCFALINGKIFFEKYKNDGFDKSFFLQDLVGEFEKGLDNRDWKEILKDIETYEKQYGRPTLNAAALSDRSYYHQPRNERARRIIKTYKSIEAFIDHIKPDFVITSGFGSLPLFATSDICQYRKIPVIYPLNTRIENYHIPCYVQYEESEVHGINYELKPSSDSIIKAKNIIEDFNKDPSVPVLEGLLSYSHFKFSFGHIYRFLRYIYRYYFSKTYFGDHTKKPPHLKLFNESKIRIKRKFYQKFIKYDDLPKDLNNWYYFPLHIQPEYTTMVCGSNCIDQIGTLISLSNSLSISEGIIVKEHPGMIGRREYSYYEAIRKIPNIKFVNTKESTFNLIKETKGTITIAGTAGIEAILLGKPVITLGNVFYNSYKNLLSLKNIPRAKWSEEILKFIKFYKYSNEALVEYVAKIVDQSERLYFIEPQDNPQTVLSDDNIENFYKFVYNQINLLIKDKKYGRTTIINKSYI